jgi:hypothetical protein
LACAQVSADWVQKAEQQMKAYSHVMGPLSAMQQGQLPIQPEDAGWRDFTSKPKLLLRQLLDNLEPLARAAQPCDLERLIKSYTALLPLAEQQSWIAQSAEGLRLRFEAACDALSLRVQDLQVQGGAIREIKAERQLGVVRDLYQQLEACQRQRILVFQCEMRGLEKGIWGQLELLHG